eukprot:COSAG05_NODE_19161_length_296_cov_4694.903553_1_plen_56_part_10
MKHANRHRSSRTRSLCEILIGWPAASVVVADEECSGHLQEDWLFVETALAVASGAA